MRRGGFGLGLAAAAVFFAQAGVAVEAGARLVGPSQGALPAFGAANAGGGPTDRGQASPTAPPADGTATAPPGGGGGGAAAPYPDLGPMVVPIDGGDRRGVDAVGGSAPPAGGGGGGGGAMAPDPDAPALMSPWFLQFGPPADRRGAPGPAGTREPTLAPGSPAPRR
jgi:hypothetical protein